MRLGSTPHYAGRGARASAIEEPHRPIRVGSGQIQLANPQSGNFMISAELLRVFNNMVGASGFPGYQAVYGGALGDFARTCLRRAALQFGEMLFDTWDSVALSRRLFAFARWPRMKCSRRRITSARNDFPVARISARMLAFVRVPPCLLLGNEGLRRRGNAGAVAWGRRGGILFVTVRRMLCISGKCCLFHFVA